jgi:hypothetical protein
LHFSLTQGSGLRKKATVELRQGPFMHLQNWFFEHLLLLTQGRGLRMAWCRHIIQPLNCSICSSSSGTAMNVALQKICSQQQKQAQ